MSNDFWQDVLEPGETLLWTGRPQPRLHWRNWRLYGPAPMATLGLSLAALIAIVTRGPGAELWVFAAASLLILLPVRTTLRQRRVLLQTRYALTDRRALFFRIDGDETRARAFRADQMIAPRRLPTLPNSIIFVQQDNEKNIEFGFEYIQDSGALTDALRTSPVPG
ncbi:hypothetical protein KDD17_11575 [Sulfitobacter albidus]|uniref:DUF2244 domain-containing protein n=1 Tax=Sulfitobacter albidus TaxID=2829501 RepID=A0A975JC88_9RHOB|nr:hypothetical protein [Sulfitobacter albidus]QUJ75595.1 hypothetical protein KDD17_11575 [Sulfitobacter albidus]